MKHRIRLQGYEFRQMKPNLTLMLNKTKVSNNGNICFIMRDRTGQEYSHWLNDIEKEQFKAKYDINRFIKGGKNKMRQTLQEFMDFNKDKIFTVNKDNDKHLWGQYSITQMPNEFRNKEVIGVEPQFDNFIKVHIEH